MSESVHTNPSQSGASAYVADTDGPSAKLPSEVLWIECEGSGCPPASTSWSTPIGYQGLCSCCGQIIPVEDGGAVEWHRRRDILAMVVRGDFDAV